MKKLVLSLLFSVFLLDSEAQCPTLTFVSSSVTCHGNSTGSATVSVSGGTAPYNYTWSPSGGNAATASGLAAGVYTVRVTDAGTCVVTGTVSIGQPNFFMAVSSQTNVICYGVTMGAASFTTIGGTPAVSFTWSPFGGNSSSATGLSPGTYTVSMRDGNNCALTETVNITGPSFSLTATTTQTNNICGSVNGGAAANVTGGTPPYTYTWSPTGGNSATATLVSGIYSVNVRDANNCQTTQTVNIIQTSLFSLVPVVTNVSCNGANDGSVSVTVSGGTAPYNYTWSPSGGNASSASGLAPGTYTLSAIDGMNCFNYTTVTISQPPVLSATSTQTLIICNGATATASVSVSGGVTPYTYSWSPSGGSASSASGLAAGSYTAYIRDANSCVITRTFSFSNPPTMTTTGFQVNINCHGAATGAASVSVGGGVPPYTYTWSPSGGNGVTATGLLAGSYTVTARDNNSCTVSRSYTITEPTQLVATVATTSVNCNGGNTGGGTLTLSGGTAPYTYTWLPTGGNAPSSSGLTAGTYSVVITDGNSCNMTQTLSIVQPLPLAAVVNHSAVTCSGLNDGAASLTISGGTTPYTYSWSPGGATTASVSSLAPGEYTVRVTDANLCTTSQTFSIINPPQFTVSVTSTSIQCGGQNTGSGTVSVLGGSPPYSYTWIPTGGNASVTTGLGPGNYSVNIRDANNCTASQSMHIAQPAMFTGSISNTPANCNNPDGSATVTVNGGSGGYTYSWSPSGGTTATATAISAGQYTCFVTDLNNCVLQLITNVTAISPSVFLTATQASICSGSSTTLTATGSDSYTWTPSLSLSAANGSVVTASPTISTTYTVTGSNLFGCVVTNTIGVQLFADPVPSLSVQAPDLCTGTTVSLSATGASGYTWSPATGLSNAFSANPTATLSGQITYTVTGENVLGCTGTSTLSLSPLPLPAVTVSASSSAICIHETATLSASGAASYTWNTGAANSVIQVSPATAESFVVTGTGANGCINTATASLGVNPLPQVSIQSNTYVCQGATAVLTASGASTYTWNTGESGLSLSVSPVANTSYTVTGADGNGCKNTATFSLVVYITPSLNISGRQEVCRNERFTLNVSGGTTYTWSTGEQTTTVSYALNANTVITVSSGLGDCPPAQASFPVTVHPVPGLTVSPTSTLINTGQQIQLVAASNETDFSWTPAAGLSCNNCPNPVAGPAASTVYTVEVTGRRGCHSTATVSIQVDDLCGELFAPSAFSPNNDGNNDTWCVYGNCITSIRCDIFNRWGQKVFTITDKDQCWDGTINGTSQNSGVFIFQAEATLINGENKTLKGNFTLIK